MTKNVTVTLIAIKNVHTGDDPGTNLEIYGDLFARRVFINELGEFEALVTEQLFHRNSSDRIDLTQGAVFPINETRTFTIQDGEFLWLGGHLAEHDDTSANDNLGFIDKKIKHDNIVTDVHTIRFQESDQIVDVTYRTTV